MARHFWWFGGGHGQSSIARSRKRLGRVHCLFEPLEARNLMHGEESFADDHPAPLADPTTHQCHASLAEMGSFDGGQAGGVAVPTLTLASAFRSTGLTAPLPTEIFDPTSDPRLHDQQMGLPLLNSNPGAPVTLYLDFTGNFESDWWYGSPGNETHFANVITPVFSMDANTGFFSATERATIKEIWSRVAEDFAPFNINVSTAYYGGFANGQALRVAIGGQHTDWLHINSSGIASIGSFSDSAPNVVFVFDLVDWASRGVSDGEGRALVGTAATATTISHEAGHAFGLRHHSRYTVNGTLIATYDPGNAGWTPIMGNNLASDRTTWDSGPTDLGPNSSQDDMEILAAPANVFGMKADDHGNTVATADPLKTSLAVFAPMTGKGIIGEMNDVDFFKFASPGGSIQVKVNAVQFGPNLIPIAELWSSSGFVSPANAGGLTQSIINANVGAGTYYVLVKGFGDYGDVGQYTVSVNHQQVLTTTTTASATSGSTAQPTTSSAGLTAAVGGAITQRTVAVQGSGVSDLTQDATRLEQPSQKGFAATWRGRAIAESHDAVFAMID
jgi:hypothetical protein